MPFPRRAGVLLHPTSLPGGHGIGDLGTSARQFVDFLEKAGMGLWQILPLGPTGAANSPYQALSSFAGNPLLISLDDLAEEELLAPTALLSESFDEGAVEYDKAGAFKDRMLRAAAHAFANGKGSTAFRDGYVEFAQEERWAEDYALFMALKERFDGKAWFQWPAPELVRRDPDALKSARRELCEEVSYRLFCQYVFYRQWRALRSYANGKNIQLMGDLPIYVAHDSADVWAAPQYFKLDEKGKTTSVAGVPPDYFSATGQLWGNPIYRWDRLQADGFGWWIDRIEATLKLVDLLRIDHFRGFAAYWEVPAGEETAINGTWVECPGDAFFEALRKRLGDLPIVAEDLGVITEDVNALRVRHGLPGMKVLQFAFNPGAQLYLPHMYETSNCVVYTATHDNDTTRGWYEATGAEYAQHGPEGLQQERDKARRYLARSGEDISMDMIRLAMQSVADTAIFLMQDVLDLGNDARMNRPGITDGQWVWRMTRKQLESAPADRLREMVWLYDRELTS